MASERPEERNFILPVAPFKGVNTFDPPFAINPDQLSLGNNIRSEGSYIGKGYGFTQIGSDSNCEGQAVFSDGTHIAWFNGSLKRWNGSAWVTVSGGGNAGTPGKRWSMVTFKDDCYMTNGYDRPLIYNKISDKLKLLGLSPTESYIRLGFVWTDETWNGSNWEIVTGTVDIQTPPERGKERRSVKLMGPGSYAVVTYSPAKNVSTFPSGYELKDYDYLELWIHHMSIEALSEVPIILSINDGVKDWSFTVGKFALRKDDFGREQVGYTNNKSTRLRIILRSFADSSGNRLTSLNSVASFRLSLANDCGNSAEIYFSSVRLVVSPPYVYTRGKKFPGEWQGGVNADNSTDKFIACTDPTPAVDDEKRYLAVPEGSGQQIVDLWKNFSATDFTKWDDQGADPSPDSDVVTFYVGVRRVHPSFTMTVTVTDALMTSVEKNITNDFIRSERSSTRLSYPKSFWSGINWSQVTGIRFRATFQKQSTYAQGVFLSNIHLAPGQYKRQLPDLNAATKDSFVLDTTLGPPPNKRSWSLSSKGTGALVGTWAFSSPQDLTVFDTGLVSDIDDYISFWIYWTNYKVIKALRVTVFDQSSNSRSYDITEFGQTRNISTYMYIKKVDFRTDSSQNFDWTKVTKFVFTLSTQAKKNATKINIADLALERVGSYDGLGMWRTRYVGEGAEIDIPPSVWHSQGYVMMYPLKVTGADLVLAGLRTPPETDTKVIEVYRRVGDQYALELSVVRGATGFPSSILVGRVPDDLNRLGKIWTGSDNSYSSDGFSVPPGQFNTLNGASHWIWGVTDYENFIYMATSFIPYAFSPTRVIIFSSPVVGVIPLLNSVYVFTRSGIKRISGNEIYHYEFTESPTASRAVAKVKSGMIVFATSDNVYLFDGSVPMAIGTPIQDRIRSADAGSTEITSFGDFIFLRIVVNNHPETWWFYLRTKTWHRFGFNDVRGGVEYNGNLYFWGGTNRNIYKLEIGSFVNSPTSEIETAHMYASNPHRKRIDSVSIVIAGEGRFDVGLVYNSQTTMLATNVPLTDYPKEHVFWVQGVTPIVGMGWTVGVYLRHVGSGDFRLMGIYLIGGSLSPGGGDA